MKKTFRLILDFWKSLNTMEERTFWTATPLFSLAGLYSIISSIFFYTYISTVLPTVLGAIHFITPIIFMFLAYRAKDTSKLYPLFCLVVSGILMPVTFLVDGGMRSGMMLFCFGSISLVTFITAVKVRYVVFGFSLLTNLSAFLVEILYPNAVIPLSEEYIQSDTFFSFTVLSVAMVLLLSGVLSEYRTYAFSRTVLSQYMDPSVQNELNRYSEGDGLNQLPGETKRVTVLFADISRFTSISETMSSKQITEFLNIFLSTAHECIQKNHGILDKYIGDCVMAYWIDNDGNGSGVREACQTALDLRDRLHELSDEIFTKFGNELDFSAGINYGEVVFGAIGSSDRKDFTIIGDAVNVAQRLEDVATKGDINISGKVVDILGDCADVMTLSESTYLRGKANPITVYRFLGFHTAEPEQENVNELKPISLDPTTGYYFYVCGCRGSYSVSGMRFTEFGGETSCYILKKDNYALIIDCGTGLYSAKNILVGCTRIDIVLSHVHYDHILGLLDWSVFPADVQPHFYGNFAEWDGDDTIHNLLRAPYWPVDLSNGEINCITPGEFYALKDDLKVRFVESKHPNHSCILQVLIQNFNMCILTDCEDPTSIPSEVTYECDMMLFDGMYEQADFENYIGWGHSTPNYGILFAKSQHVKKLIITHHNPKFGDRKLNEMEREASRILPGTTFARAGDKYSI